MKLLCQYRLRRIILMSSHINKYVYMYEYEYEYVFHSK